MVKGGSNFLLRKRRKWPRSPYKAKWHEIFNQQQAMQTLIREVSASQNPTHQPHLQTLINSFDIYNCDPTPQAYQFVIKTLMQTRQFHQLPPVLHHLENTQKFEIPEHIFVHLIKMYADANQIKEAIDVFYKIPKLRCVPTVHSLNTLLLVLCKRKECLAMVPQILLRSQHMNIRLEESTYRILITALCRNNRLKYAVKLLNCMLIDGFMLDKRMCSLLLSYLCDQLDLSSDQLLSFLREMRGFGFVPDGTDCANIIKFLVKEGKGNDALIVLNQLKTDGIKPDIVCYTMALRGVILTGDYDTADALFDEIIVLGLVPNVNAYNVYIYGLCKQSKVKDGYKMLACMEDLGCRPDLITYNTLLDGFCKIGELGWARKIVREMELKGVGTNLQTHRIMLDGLVLNGEISKACASLEEMLDSRLWPRSSTVEEILCQLWERGLVSEALRLFEKILRKAIVPGPRALKALLLNHSSRLNPAEITLTNLANPV